MLSTGYQPESNNNIDPSNPPKGGSGVAHSHVDYGKHGGDKTAGVKGYKNKEGKVIIESVKLSETTKEEAYENFIRYRAKVLENALRNFGIEVEIDISTPEKLKRFAEVLIDAGLEEDRTNYLKIPLNMLRELRNNMQSFLDNFKCLPITSFPKQNEPEIITLKEMLRKVINVPPEEFTEEDYQTILNVARGMFINENLYDNAKTIENTYLRIIDLEKEHTLNPRAKLGLHNRSIKEENAINIASVNYLIDQQDIISKKHDEKN